MYKKDKIFDLGFLDNGKQQLISPFASFNNIENYNCLNLKKVDFSDT